MTLTVEEDTMADEIQELCDHITKTYKLDKSGEMLLELLVQKSITAGNKVTHSAIKEGTEQTAKMLDDLVKVVKGKEEGIKEKTEQTL